MDVQQSVLARMLGQADLGEVHGADGRAVVAVERQLLGDLAPDIVLSLDRASADVRRQDHVVEASQGRLERVIVGRGLGGEYVDRGTQESFLPHRRGERIDVDNRAAGCIDEYGLGANLRDPLSGHQTARGRCVGNV